MSTTLTLSRSGMDDCDAATLVGILRDALAAHPRARQHLAGRELVVTTHETMDTGDRVDRIEFPDDDTHTSKPLTPVTFTD